MKNVSRIFWFVSVLIVWAALCCFDITWPKQIAHDSVASLNGGNRQVEILRRDEWIKNTMDTAAATWTMLAGWMILASLYPDRERIKLPGNMTLFALAALLFSSGCTRPYDAPEYADVDTAETAFMVPLEGDIGDQARFQSEQFLEQHKIAAKRVQITHRWNQTGRSFLWMDSGQWIPDVRLIKVNRSPVTRQWSADDGKDKAIWVESADSVGFSMGFMVSAFITEPDAAKFLYWYPAGSLADVMDNEIRGRIQQDAAEAAASYPLDALRGKKQEVMNAVRKDVVPFFAARGITISTVGMYGGMTYENPEIQASIDAVFVAQQLKNVNLAKFEAQQKENERIDLEASGLALKAKTIAQGESDARIISAQAEAKSIELVNQALTHGAGPQLIALRQIDIEKARVEKWDGRYPTYFMGGSSSANPSLLLSIPDFSQSKQP